ncbi:MAG: enoyl-CoA hydratase/isomerase family protein [Gammaproteobacteria bacterium]|nr:enoyl-CoA hydratase/isomerase family protein [Gammaproteobacteria bacterium]
MGEVLRTRREGAALVLELNRPERHHAINAALADALIAAFDMAEADDDVRVVVVSGAGERAFCAGQDMLEASGVEAGARDAKVSSAMFAVERVERCRLPVIAAVNGYCFGGGAALAIACDIRLGAHTASFRLPGAEYGLVVGAAALPRLVGAAKAKELIFTARRFDAAEALACGLLNAVHEPASLLPAALDMAAAIAANSPRAVQESKRIIDRATLVEAACEAERAINRELRGSTEQSARFRDATRRVTGR